MKWFQLSLLNFFSSTEAPILIRTSIIWQVRPQIGVTLDKPCRWAGITWIRDIQEGAGFGIAHAKGHEVEGMLARQNDKVSLDVAGATS